MFVPTGLVHPSQLSDFGPKHNSQKINKIIMIIIPLQIDIDVISGRPNTQVHKIFHMVSEDA